MGKHFAWKIEAGTTVKLKDYTPDFAGDRLNRDEAESELQVLTQELSELQEFLYEAHHHSILTVLQGMDTSGKVWRNRYKEINHFENLLANNNTLILKFFLHISYDEQTERLQARIQDKNKAWKISASDWSERKYWDDYQKAYEDVLIQCNEIPWYIVPANHKWYRNLAVAHALVTIMRKYKNEWEADLQERGKQELEKLKNLSAVMSEATETTSQ